MTIKNRTQIIDAIHDLEITEATKIQCSQRLMFLSRYKLTDDGICALEDMNADDAAEAILAEVKEIEEAWGFVGDAVLVKNQ